jgi:polyisoprenoid-binding protein YceI
MAFHHPNVYRYSGCLHDPFILTGGSFVKKSSEPWGQDMTLHTTHLGSLMLGAAMLVAPARSAQATPLPRVVAADTTITRWRIDPIHSEITFRLRHFLGRIRGRFDTWQGELLAQGTDWSTGTVAVTVDAKSIDTGSQARDEDLRSERFFAVAKYPKITFRSTRVDIDGNDITLTGRLKIRDHEEQVVFRGQYHGIVKDLNGNERVAFDAAAPIDRNRFGIVWNQFVESGTRLGDTVDLEIAIEAVRIR